MKTFKLKKRCKDYLEKLIREIRKEKSNESILQYLDFCSRFHGYSFRNTLLIWASKPDATYVAGFKAWQKMGRRIKKGEKGIAIFAPMKVKSATLDQEEEEEERIIYKVVYVWDVSQTEGKPLPKALDTLSVEGEISGLLPVLEEVTRAFGIKLEYVKSLQQGYGVSKMGCIQVLEDLRDEEKFSLLAHELSHELLHGIQERMNLSRKIKELEAEAAAYIVCRHFRLKPKSPTYLVLYRVEEVDIKNSLERILSTGSRIIQSIINKREKNKIAKAA